MQKLLMFLTDFGNKEKDVVAATLAWICQKRNWLFEIYYDAYHSGTHCGGDEAEGGGELFGSTVVGGRHFEHFQYLNSKFDVYYGLAGDSVLEPLIPKNNIISKSRNIFDFYNDVFSFFGMEFPHEAVMLGQNTLDLHAYCSPEIYFRNAIGVDETINDEDLTKMSLAGLKKIHTMFVKEKTNSVLQGRGFSVELLDSFSNIDNYTSITSRIARRWLSETKGFFLGGPIPSSYWLPWCLRHKFLAIYGTPHTSILENLKEEIREKDNVIYGRQFQDEDFLALSKLNKCFQLVDPCRPVFPVMEHASHTWSTRNVEGIWISKPSDDKLQEFAADNRILSSLIFWCGDLRSIETLYGILELVSATGVNAGLVISAQWYQYSLHPYLELIYTPLAKGGCHPNLEPILGSSVLGVSFESYLSPPTLCENLIEGRGLISNCAGKDLVPSGWFPIMDSKLVKKKIPGYSLNRLGYSKDFPFLIRRKRPFDDYRPDKLDPQIFSAAKKAGFSYAFTKSRFGQPRLLRVGEDFFVLNLTAGKWEGWSPFIAVNSLKDLITAERRLLAMGKPGWLIGVVDSCLWTFTNHIWSRGHELEKMCRFLANGGNSGKLINAVPRVISRYAKIISDVENRR